MGDHDIAGSIHSYQRLSRNQKLRICAFTENRRLGQRKRLHTESALSAQLYSAMHGVRFWAPDKMKGGADRNYGAIFNFDFSTDGALLGAACESKSVLLLDPHNGSLVKAKSDAHTDCVNCVRFLDQRSFVTCSDDATVALWDVRNMGSKVHNLRGHSNWVKNIEYSRRDGLLVTSGFDGSIYTWDINKFSSDSINFNRVFHTSGLVRSRLTPDGSKLVIATCHGYLMVVHNLDLEHLHCDLKGFKPRSYHLWQLNRFSRVDHAFDHVFARERNRVELIADFPSGNEAGMIASLEIHPQGWCVASRNTSEDENTEWSCVHDIQDRPQLPKSPSSESTKHALTDSSSDSSDHDGDACHRECPSTPRKKRRLSTNPHPTSSDDATSLVSVSINSPLLVLRDPVSSTLTIPSVPHFIDQLRPHRYRTLKREAGLIPVFQSIPRLTHFLEEPNVGQGFIKEISFSRDGRLLASPFGFGVRLLSFDPLCREVCDLDTTSPCQLHEIASNMSHSKEVVTTKFSPTDCLLVTGCLNGKIGFHQPVL